MLRLGLSTIQEKTDAIRDMVFLRNLRKLEYRISLFSYYRRFVRGYTTIVKPLVEIKTRGFRDSPSNKGGSRRRYTVQTEFDNLLTEYVYA